MMSSWRKWLSFEGDNYLLPVPLSTTLHCSLFLSVSLPQEMGGYFIVNGNERLIRMLILPRRNYVRDGNYQSSESTCKMSLNIITHFMTIFLSLSCFFKPTPTANSHITTVLEDKRSPLHRVWCTDKKCTEGPEQLSEYMYLSKSYTQNEDMLILLKGHLPNLFSSMG